MDLTNGLGTKCLLPVCKLGMDWSASASRGCCTRSLPASKAAVSAHLVMLAGRRLMCACPLAHPESFAHLGLISIPPQLPHLCRRSST